MRVTQLDVHVRRPDPANARPIRDALQSLPGAGSVEVVIRTDEGITGEGSIGFGRVVGAPDALAALIEHELKPLVIGADPAQVRQIHQRMLRETEYHGSSGLAMFGIAAVDTALWDCLGKAHQTPCWQLWGAAHERIPAYAMVGWLNYSGTELQEICAKAVGQGFCGVKVKVGGPSLAEDVSRVQAVRHAIGDDIRLMVDANQSLTTKEAIRRGRAFQDLDCYWWEEPIPADDVDGYALLAQTLDMPIATGENLYTPAQFARFLRRDAIDIVQPDLRRAGGPTALLAIGMLAHAFGRPYASHGGGAAHLSVMACLPNTIYLETGLLRPESPLTLVDGCVELPQGAGFDWSEEQKEARR
jgi:L-alanine-DL-glutamate epimerase-like enolase superfamily enzyme